MPLLATLSSHFSAILHNVIFSFPSPSNETMSDPAETIQAIDEIARNNTLFPGVAKMVQQPSEHRALAGGIGPLTFVGSGYGVMLVLMALLLNRIHHIVRRPRIPARPLPHPPVNSLFWKARRTVTRFLVSPETPRMIRLPGIICLCRAIILFTVLILQVANLWPVNFPWILRGPIERSVRLFGDWAGGMQMETVCWQVFLSVCAGLVSSGLADGLDQRRRGAGNSGFNLFGYAFLLHLYSSPLTHQHPPPTASYGRPDIHPLFQLWLGLVELTWLQAIELFDSTRGRQLAPTAVCGSLGLVHFVYVLFTSPLKFPSFTFLTHLLALFLSVIIVFTTTLTAFTHIFTLGYIPSPIIRNLLPHEGVMPRAEDDFGVALLKLGSACMWSSQYGGMRNELVNVSLKSGPWLALSAGHSSVSTASGGGFGTEITQIEVEQQEETRRQEEYIREMKAFWRALWVVLVNFATAVLLSLPGGKKVMGLAVRAWDMRWWYGPRQWKFWRRAAWTYRDQAARRRAERLLDGQRLAAEIGRRRADESVGTSTALVLRGTEGAVIPYDQYLRGEVQMEDDEEDWQDEDDDDDSISSGSSSSDIDEGPSLQDFLPDSNHTDNLQPVLLAHLTSSATSPLTRRRYNALLAPPSPSPTRSRGLTPSLSGIDRTVYERRLATMNTSSAGNEWDDERRRACVICTVEPRDTILWPCRCLALCNDCRESLAARMESKEHLCPCCRKKVDGYSRIFVP